MTAYEYQAIKQTGQSTKGVIRAESLRDARSQLKMKGLIPTRVEVQSDNKKTSKKSFHSRDLTLVTRQMATLLSAGIPLDEALLGVSEQSEKPSVKALLLGIRGKVLEGFGFAQALQEYPKAFPELYTATVAAGEQTGRLDTILEKLADYTEHQQEIRQKTQHALLYPSIMLFISLAIISFLLAFVVPKIIGVFEDTGEALPTATHALILISNMVKHYGLYFLGLFGILGYAFKRSLRHPANKKRWHEFLLKIPGIRHMIITTNVARFSHTFAILFSAGVSVIETMRVSASLVNHVIMREALETAKTRVKEGMPINLALKDTGFFSPMALHLIASGEKSGQISGMMSRVAHYLDTEVRRLIDTGLTLLEPMVILFMGGVILFVVLATLLPIFSMEQLVS